MIYGCAFCAATFDDGVRSSDGPTFDVLLIDVCPACQKKHPERTKARTEAWKKLGDGQALRQLERAGVARGDWIHALLSVHNNKEVLAEVKQMLIDVLDVIEQSDEEAVVLKALEAFGE